MGVNRAFAIILSLGLLAACEKKTAPQSTLTVSATGVRAEDVTVYDSWVGLLDGYQNAKIRAQVTGYLISQNYHEGSFVKKGDVLFLIDARPFEAALAQSQADYAQKVAQAQLAQITLNRQTELYKTKVISEQEFDTASQDARAAAAAAAAAQASVQAAQVNLNYCTISAPFDGIAGRALAQIGDLVGPGGSATVLTEMSQVDPIKAIFSITEAQYLQAADLLQQMTQRATDENPARITMKLVDGKEYAHSGRFDFVNRQVNVGTGTIEIDALFPNPGNVLRPGLFARVTAPVRIMKDALVVPQIAVMEVQGIRHVAVVGKDNTIEIRPVEVGPTQGQDWVITSGVSQGEQVVVGGIEKVRPGMKVNVKPYQPDTSLGKGLNTPGGGGATSGGGQDDEASAKPVGSPEPKASPGSSPTPATASPTATPASSPSPSPAPGN